MEQSAHDRRSFLKSAAAATTVSASILTRNVKGANNKISVAFIGLGRMGRSNLEYAMKQPAVEIAALCDVYQPCLDLAMQQAGGRPKRLKDFHQILNDKAIDAVCISTPDHWHPYLSVEACKAG